MFLKGAGSRTTSNFKHKNIRKKGINNSTNTKEGMDGQH